MPLSVAAQGVGGLFSGLGSLFTSNKSLKATRETNAQNYKIWQEQQAHNIDMFNRENKANIDMFNMQNRANIDMFNRQNQAEIDMWNMNNAYNDPSAQVARLRNAGLNPSLMMGNNPSGVATSSPHSANLSAGNLQAGNATPANAIPMQQPDGSAFRNHFSSALEGIVSVAQAFNIGADTDKKKGELDTINALRPLQVRDLTESYGLKIAQAYQAYQNGDVARRQAEYDRLTQNFRVEYSRELTDFLKAQRIGQIFSNQQQAMINRFIPAERTLMLYNSIANFFAINANTRLTEKQIATEIEKRLDIAVGRQLKEGELKLFNDTKDWMIKQINSAYELDWLINQGGYNHLSGWSGHNHSNMNKYWRWQYGGYTKNHAGGSVNYNPKKDEFNFNVFGDVETRN